MCGCLEGWAWGRRGVKEAALKEAALDVASSKLCQSVKVLSRCWCCSSPSHLHHLCHVQAQASAAGGRAFLPNLAPHGRYIGVVIKLRQGRKATRRTTDDDSVQASAPKIWSAMVVVGPAAHLPAHPATPSTEPSTHLRHVSRRCHLAGMLRKHIRRLTPQLPQQQACTRPGRRMARSGQQRRIQASPS